MHMRSSELEIKDINIYKYCLLQHDLPIIINSGIIKNMKVHIPGLNIMSDPFVCSVTNTFIYGKALCSANSIFPSSEEINAIKAHQLLSHELFKDKYSTILKIFSAQSLTNPIFAITKNCVVTVDNVLIYMQFGEGSDAFFVGITIEKLEIGKIEPHKSIGAELEKGFHVTNFGVFIEDGKSPIPSTEPELFFKNMSDIYTSNHNYVIGPISVGGCIYYDSNTKKLNVKLNTPDVKINLAEWQMHCMLSVIPNFERFNRFRKTKHIQRLTKKDKPENWWQFVHSAASKINEPDTDEFGKFSNNFQLMQLYLQLIHDKKKKKAQEQLEAIDQTLPYYQIILYRTLSEKIGKKIRVENVRDAVSFCEKDPQTIYGYLFRIASIELNAEIYRFICKPTMTVLVSNLKAIASYTTEGYAAHASCTSFMVMSDFESGNASTVVQTAGDPIFEISFLLYKPFYPYLARVRGNVDHSHYIVNLNALKTFRIDPEIIKVLKYFLGLSSSMKPIDIDFDCKQVQIHIKLIDQLHFHTMLDTMSIKTAPDNDILCNITNFNFAFGEDNEKVMLYQMNLKAIMNRNQIKFMFSPMNVLFSWADAFLIQKINPFFIELAHIVGDMVIRPSINIVSLIPSIDVSLDLPSSTNLFHINIKNIKTSLDLSEMKGQIKIEKISSEDLFESENIVTSVSNNIYFVDIDYLLVNLFGVLQILPDDLMKILTLEMPKSQFSFHINKSIVESTIQEKLLAFTMVDFNGKNISTSIELTGLLQSLQFQNLPIIKDVKYLSYIKILNIIEIKVNFEEMDANVWQDLVQFAANLEIPLEDLFPVGFGFHWLIHTPKITITPILYVTDFKFQFEINHDYLNGTLSIDEMNVIYCTFESTQSLMLSFDIQKRYFEVVTNIPKVAIDYNNLIGVLQDIVEKPIRLDKSIFFKIVLLPIEISLNIEGQTITCLFDSFGSFDMAKVESDITISNFQLFFNNVKYVGVESIALSGTNELNLFIPDFYFVIPHNFGLDLIKTLFKMKTLNMEKWRARIKRNLPPICINCSSTRILFSTLFISADNSTISYYNDKFTFETSYQIEIMKTWAQRQVLIDKNKLVASLHKKEVYFEIIDSLDLNLNSFLLESLFSCDLAKNLEILNNTGICFQTNMGEIKQHSTFVDHTNSRQLNFISKFGKFTLLPSIEKRRVFLDKKVLNITWKSDCLHINEENIILNKTHSEFKLFINGEWFCLKPFGYLYFETLPSKFSYLDKEYSQNSTSLIIGDTYGVTFSPNKIVIRPQIMISNKMASNLNINIADCNLNIVGYSKQAANVEYKLPMPIIVERTLYNIDLDYQDSFMIKSEKCVLNATIKKKFNCYTLIFDCEYVYCNHIHSYSLQLFNKVKKPIGEPFKGAMYSTQAYYLGFASCEMCDQKIDYYLNNQMFWIPTETSFHPIILHKYNNEYHIQPIGVFVNQLKYTLNFSFGLTILPSESLNIGEMPKEFRIFEAENDCSYSMSLSNHVFNLPNHFNPISLHVFGDRYIFSELTQFPCALLNTTDHFLTISQQGVILANVIPHTTQFFTPIPGDSLIVLTSDVLFQGIEIDIRIPSFMKKVQYSLVYYAVDLMTNGTTRITISDRIENEEHFDFIPYSFKFVTSDGHVNIENALEINFNTFYLRFEKKSLEIRLDQVSAPQFLKTGDNFFKAILDADGLLKFKECIIQINNFEVKTNMEVLFKLFSMLLPVYRKINANSLFWCIKHYKMNQIKFTFSTSAVDSIFALIPRFNQSHINIKPIEMTGATTSRIFRSLTRRIAENTGNFFGSLTIIGSPATCYHHWLDIKKRNPSLIDTTRGALGCIMLSLENIIEYLDSVFTYISKQIYDRKDQTSSYNALVWGIKSFIYGFIYAITGVTRTPLKNDSKHKSIVNRIASRVCLITFGTISSFIVFINGAITSFRLLLLRGLQIIENEDEMKE